ncbi:hypothetical protein [Psychrobacter sp.]|uniref:hypothetical protein n=1 Tax=Psychrobacter sp. TaxID=56811 RepID=UPI0025D619A5|nr:hypothetical protein [Psychrobacter sp.]
MSILVRLTSATETATYEGCALALTLASFGHEVQLMLGSSVFGILMQPESRLHGMIKSLDLYDLPPAWLPDDVFSSWIFGMVPAEVSKQIDFVPENFDSKKFAQVFSF